MIKFINHCCYYSFIYNHKSNYSVFLDRRIFLGIQNNVSFMHPVTQRTAYFLVRIKNQRKTITLHILLFHVQNIGKSFDSLNILISSFLSLSFIRKNIVMTFSLLMHTHTHTPNVSTKQKPNA